MQAKFEMFLSHESRFDQNPVNVVESIVSMHYDFLFTCLDSKQWLLKSFGRFLSGLKVEETKRGLCKTEVFRNSEMV